jgi:hypothetical protein
LQACSHAVLRIGKAGKEMAKAISWPPSAVAMTLSWLPARSDATASASGAGAVPLHPVDAPHPAGSAQRAGFLRRARACLGRPFFEMPHLARIPLDALVIGENTLTIRMVRAGGFSVGYLAPAWLGSDTQILPHHQLLSFLVDLQHQTVQLVSPSKMMAVPIRRRMAAMAWATCANAPRRSAVR